ncbi:uncharacterized protein E0L32_004436 [Thyridium curvatum]|uniref:Putative phospholipase n=1 Tax=Thyridium curvatum TaxID=1093900 RepID=A0A507B8I8_9PEZI|nr:uncharacterized protein E0L32_004436 [Thyridium curvatum]TPX15456.1 hypothetical protein E0L32_004436 [Thyridium curvatum]
MSLLADDLELQPYTDEPDLPLAMASPTTLTTPLPRLKWLDGARTSRKWFSERFTDRLRTLLRPRFTWRYILCSTIGLYIVWCFVRGQPLLSSRLPAYSGRYEVGTLDLEIPLETPVRISDTLLKSSGEPAFEVETVLFTLYYPALRGSRSDKPKHLWAPRPLSLTAEGYARIARVNNFLIRPVFTFALWLIVGSIEIPAQVDVPLHHGGGGGEKLPVMVFSHGMASSRTDYTHYLGEMASRGHVVAAVEHRDGSSPGSLVCVAGKQDRRVVLFQESDLVSDPPMDTPRIKREQLAFRDAEILETIRVLRAIHDGRGHNVSALSSRGEGRDTLHRWTGRLDFDRLTIGGHSYGATGALQALRSRAGGGRGGKLQLQPGNGGDQSISPAAVAAAALAVGGIILDPGKESGPLNAEIDVPILVVHSNTWSRARSLFFGRPHFDTVKELVRGTLDRVGASWFVTSIGTSHPSVTDAPLLQPLLLSWTTGATVDVKEGLKEYVRIAMDFHNFLHKGNATGVLAEKATHDEYGEWVSEERKEEFPKSVAKFWEIHVSPEDSVED